MKLPIIINSNGDIYFYRSLESAQLDIEPIDVKNNEYLIYDSAGLLLSPIVIDSPLCELVRINPTNEVKKGELIKILIDYFEEIGHDRLILETMDLPELIQIGLAYFK